MSFVREVLILLYIKCLMLIKSLVLTLDRRRWVVTVYRLYTNVHSLYVFSCSQTVHISSPVEVLMSEIFITLSLKKSGLVQGSHSGNKVAPPPLVSVVGQYKRTTA